MIPHKKKDCIFSLLKKNDIPYDKQPRSLSVVIMLITAGNVLSSNLSHYVSPAMIKYGETATPAADAYDGSSFRFQIRINKWSISLNSNYR